MSFWINGTQVTTVTDTTYADNSAIGFGVNDWSAKSPVSALFSNFQYEELPSGTLATPAVVATATAQAQASMQTSYTARVPGYNCDKGAGQWQPLADDEVPGTLHCLPTGLQVTAPTNTQIITTENFYWLHGHFPQNYKIEAKIDVSGASNGCAALGTRANTNDDKYAFIICPNGSWTIALITNKFQRLAEGWVNAQSTYTITAQANGSAQSLYINGQLIKTINDSHLKTTGHLSLLVGLYQSNQPVTAVFSNFTFTPLS